MITVPVSRASSPMTMSIFLGLLQRGRNSCGLPSGKNIATGRVPANKQSARLFAASRMNPTAREKFFSGCGPHRIWMRAIFVWLVRWIEIMALSGNICRGAIKFGIRARQLRSTSRRAPTPLTSPNSPARSSCFRSRPVSLAGSFRPVHFARPMCHRSS